MGINFKEERVEELKLFGLGLFGINGAPEMMLEIVKEAAKRFAWRSEQSQVSETSAIARGPGIVKVRIVIEKSWAPSESFDVDGIHLEELIKMAEAVGAEFKITEVQDFSFISLFALTVLSFVAAHIAQQGDSLSKLELNYFNICDEETRELFFSLQQASKEWSILYLDFSNPCREEFWEVLARISANGNIGSFTVFTYKNLGHNQRLGHPGANQDDLMKVWRMSEKVAFEGFSTQIEIGGGKGADTEAEWERMLELVFEV